MPTVLTHAFVGAVIPTSCMVPSRPGLRFHLAVASLLPDLDVVGFPLGYPYGHLLSHRGVTHSLAFAMVVGAVAPTLLYGSVPRGSRAWFGLAALFFAACASHPLLDACTDGGFGMPLLVPLDSTRFFFPWRPIPVSPIGLEAFFRSTRALRILVAEALYVWLPLGVLAGIMIWLRPRSGTGAAGVTGRVDAEAPRPGRSFDG